MKKTIIVFIILIPLTLWAGINDDFFNAARTGNYFEIKNLIDNGINIDSRDDTGSTALIYASSWGHIKIVKLLLENEAKIDIACLENMGGFTALTMASLKGHTEIIKILKKSGAGTHDDLTTAAKNGDTERLSALFSEGNQNINEKDKFGSTPLMWATLGNFNNYSKTIDLLLKNGADPNISGGKDNHSPLMTACSMGNIEIVQKLLNKGADLNFTNIHGETALMSASCGGHIKVVKLLLEKGADPNIFTNKGETAFTYNSLFTDNKKNEKGINKLLKEFGAKE